jgi:ADP-heptose:LPS heptosyltransferase
VNTKKLVLKIIKIPLSGFINFLLKNFNIFVIYRIGSAIGDQLCITALLRLIHQQYPFKIVVISSYPEIFHNNPRVWKNFGVEKNGNYLPKILRLFSGAQLENFLYANSKLSYIDFMRLNGEGIHLTQAHSLHFQHNINFTEIINEIYFSEDEIKIYKRKFKLPINYSLISPLGKSSYTPNKNWGFENFQNVVKYSDNIRWIQVGLPKDKKLFGVVDCFQNITLRELFYLTSKAQFILAEEGLLNHISSAFKTRSYVVHSAFSQLSLAHYQNTVLISNHNACEFAPCWRLEECGVKNKPCIFDITPKTVLEIIDKD